MPEDAGQLADGPGQTERTSPTVLVRSVLPGVISRAVLLVPRSKPVTGPAQKGSHDGTDRPAAKPSAAGGEPGGSSADEKLPALPNGVGELAGLDGAERRLFDPPPGTLAARLLTFQRQHPSLYASRQVAIAVGEVVLGLLGVALFIQLILRGVVNWITERLPRFDLPSLPWPDIDLPSIPWPDLPDFALPGGLLAVAGTAKYWVPILVAIGLPPTRPSAGTQAIGYERSWRW